MECPVGNTLASKLLLALLTDYGYSVQLVRVTPSRNDRRTLGLTRAELLSRRLDQFGLRSHDLVVYVDEWNTGTNFNRIAGYISQYVGRMPGVFLLPVALLSPNADERKIQILRV